MPVVTVPLLSEYKTEFVLGRLAETFLGGPKTFPGSTWSMNLVQVVLHQFPLALMIIGVSCYETGTVPLHVCCLAVGSSAATIVLAVQCLVRHMKLLREPNTNVKSQTYECKDSQVSTSNVNVQNNCCNPDVVESIIPAKRFRANIFIHSLVSALLCGYAVAYLAPSHLQRMCGSYSVAYLVSTLGTFSLCVAQYSLTARTPPETATFRPLDHLELRPLMRPLYIGVCYVLDIVTRSIADQGCEIANKVLHVVFVLLPLLWFLNILPPLDALVPWFSEQVHIFLGGGSAACGDLRLLAQVVMWAMCVTVVHFIPSTQWAIVLATVFGFVLSLDLAGFFAQLTGRCRSLRSRVFTTRVETYSSVPMTTALKWTSRHYVFFATMLVITTGLVCIIQSVQTSKKVRQTTTHVLGISLVATFSITATVSSLSRIHLVFGLVKNPFYRVHTSTGVKSVSTLQDAMSKLRVALISVVCPLLMVCFITVSLAAFHVNVESRMRLGFFWAVAVLRAFRWVWQQTEVALTEIAIMYLMHTCFIPEDSISLVNSLLLASFIHDRVIEFLSKITVAFVISTASITQLKQRRPYSYCLLVTNILLFPALLAILVGSSLISAPLLPLFTLPIFAVGFPRPLRFWPTGVDSPSSSSSDAVYYEISVSQLVTGFAKCCIYGSASDARPGDYFLARFEDRLVFFCVTEAGYGYVTLRVEGLELQHTSCHAIEAARLDQIIDDAFGLPPSEGGRRWNRRPLHTFQPFDTISINTHIDGRSVLTGVLDRTLTLKLLAKCIPQCLIWVLANQCAGESRVLSQQSSQDKPKDVDTVMKRQSVSEERKDSAFGSPQRTTEIYAMLPRPSTARESVDTVEETVVLRAERPMTGVKTRCRDGPFEAWADDEDPLGTVVNQVVSSAPVFRNGRLSQEDGRTAGRAKTSGWSEAVRDSNLPGAIVELVDIQSWPSFGLPAIDVGAATPIRIVEDFKKEKKVATSRYAKVFGPREDWMQGLAMMKDDSDGFEDEWFKTVIRKVREVTCAGDQYEGQMPEDDAILMQMYRQVVTSCQRAVNPSDAVLTPSLAAHVFGGDLPWSQNSEWLLCHPQLRQLVIKAFRYACKLALDQALLGEVDSNEELLEYLDSYDKHWYIGPDTDPSWTEALRKPMPGLFSFSFNQISGSFVSHVATFQKQAVALGKLNREAVRAVWATLNLELLYLTNDDEERYSIQAHSSLLRNLAVQAAWPPLGYPVFVSSPLVCPTFTRS